MATKKEKRAAALARHQAYFEELKNTGLKAMTRDRDHRREKDLQEWEENHTKNHSSKKVITECPHCRRYIAAQKRAEKDAKKQPNDVVFLSPSR